MMLQSQLLLLISFSQTTLSMLIPPTLSPQSWHCAVNRPDQLEDVVDEAGAVVAAQGSVVVLQQFDNWVPPVAGVVNHVVAAHVHVELHPVHLLWQVQDVCMEEGGVKTRVTFSTFGERMEIFYIVYLQILNIKLTHLTLF